MLRRMGLAAEILGLTSFPPRTIGGAGPEMPHSSFFRFLNSGPGADPSSELGSFQKSVYLSASHLRRGNRLRYPQAIVIVNART